jgi:phospholipid/cholesterol/gamma-HCH transport system substrate-binding protein
VSIRLGQLLDDRNVKNLARTIDNVATASDGLREMPVIMAALKEALSEKNLRGLRQILAHVEKTAGEAAPLAVEMRDLVKSMGTLSRRLEHVAGSAGDELTASTLPRANALIDELAGSSRQLSRILDGLESNPQMLLFGRDGASPGPGEAGFAAPVKTGESK